MSGPPWTYTDTPIQSHFPGNDSPLMRINYSSIASIIGVDHVTFNSSPTYPGSSQGFHQQVTFAANNVPSTTPPLPVLFTNTVNSVPQLFYYSGSAASGANQYNIGAQGSTMLLGGVILKWGSFSGGNSIQTISFAVPFPNNIFSVVTSSGSKLNSISLANFVITPTPLATQYYIAIGN